MSSSRRVASSVPHSFFRRSVIIAALVAVSLLPVQSKEAPLTAVELYNGASGPAYVQITDVLINGKIEMRSCASTPSIDKSSYAKLQKVNLAVGDSLDYGPDGKLTLANNATSTCVVPGNLKLEKNGPMSPSDLAAKAVLQARVIAPVAGASDTVPSLKPGVKLVFIAAPDVELAEYLLAERASDIPGWQAYISKYPDSSHTAQAKQSLASLLVKDGEQHLAVYENAMSAPNPPYGDLKKAKERADRALATVPGNPAASKLNEKVHADLTTLVDQGKTELKAYKEALAGHTPGYVHLLTARKLADAVVDVDPHFPPAVALQNDSNNEAGGVEGSLKSAESLLASKQFDDAYAAIAPYRMFAGEEARIATVVNATYEFHFQRGQESVAGQKWQEAADDFQKALDIKKTPEVETALKNSTDELGARKNKNAAQAALQQSASYEQQHDYILAYEVLNKLPQAQKPLVADEIERLKPAYVRSASQAAKDIQRAHDPIRGLADEVEMQRAYGYLESAYALTNDPSYRDRMDNIGNRLSEYYLQQAKRYLEKPLGSGAGLAWSYLDKAMKYKAANIDAVRDEMTRDNLAYQMRSKLSIGVVFRDQTSRRDSSGFADQLADAIATNLEASGLPVKVIRPGDTPAFAPNFQLIGDVLQHRPTKDKTSQPKESKYRAGEHEAPNEEWNKANRDYEAATLEFQSAQSALQGSTAKGKKVKEAQRNVEMAQAKVQAAHVKLDSIPRTLPIDVLRPYTYTETVFDMGAVVELQFRINNSAGQQVESGTPINRDVHQKFTVTENVKPEDTEGVKGQGTVPDEIQFLTDVENDARDSLIKAVKEKVAELPAVIFVQAKRKADDGDLDGAAESYILYLNSTPDLSTPQRQQAMRFLQEQFNIGHTLKASL